MFVIIGQNKLDKNHFWSVAQKIIKIKNGFVIAMSS